MRVLLVIIILTTGIASSAQSFSIRGKVIDIESSGPIEGSTVQLKGITDSTVSYSTFTDTAGRFSFTQVQPGTFHLLISSVGYGNFTRTIKIDSADLELEDYQLARDATQLSGVTVTATVPVAIQKGDTVQFNASQYKVNPDASAEDLAKKIPGITVENGQVKANGENVQKVTLDGRELFGDDATAALRNLPAEIIDKIQVFDRLSEQAQLTGFDDGNSQKGINIVTKANMRNGQFGRVYAGFGTDERYQAGGNATLLKENRKISLVGNFNNVNQQNFAQQDLLGVTSSGQRGGGGRGGPPGGGGGNFGNRGNFQVGQQPGINRTNALGLNYSDVWGEKVTATGSYFFNSSDNTTEEISNIQYLAGTRLSSRDSNNASSTNGNHRMNLRIEYKIDSANQLIFIPSLRLQKNESDRIVLRNILFNPESHSNLSRTNTSNTTSSNRVARNFDNRILYRHSFPKKGRTLAVDLETSYNDRERESYTTAFQENVSETGDVDDTTTNRLNLQPSEEYEIEVDFDYSEPVGKEAQIQLSYEPSVTRSNSNQQVFAKDLSSGTYTDFLDSLSNQFENKTVAHNAGLSYRWGNRDRQISFGVNYQYTNLMSDQALPRTFRIDKSFHNILPNARIQYKLSPKNSLRLQYRSRVNQPSVDQLAGVIDPTNAPFYSIGNPELDQQYSNTISSQFTHTNTGKGILLMANIFYQSASGYIANATFVPARDTIVGGETLPEGSELRKPVNLDGYNSIRSFVTLAVPLKFIKSNLNLNGGINFNRLPGIFENQETETRNLVYTLGTVIASNVSEFIDFTVSYSGSFNVVESSRDKAETDNNYYSHVAGVQLNLLSKNGWFFQNDMNNQFFSGLANGENEQYLLWNMGAGKKFLPNRKGELRLNVFDLLQQNQAIVRNVTDTSIEEVQSVVLKQYFMLTFTYNLRNFGDASLRTGRGQSAR